MITKFDSPTPSKGFGGILKLALLVGAIYVGYRYVYLPYFKNEKNEPK